VFEDIGRIRRYAAPEDQFRAGQTLTIPFRFKCFTGGILRLRNFNKSTNSWLLADSN
jgi:hypothetical protein